MKFLKNKRSILCIYKILSTTQTILYITQNANDLNFPKIGTKILFWEVEQKLFYYIFQIDIKLKTRIWFSKFI